MSLTRKHISIGKWLGNNKFVAVLSLVLALVIWLIVALQMSNQTVTNVNDIPVEVDTTTPDNLELRMFGQTDLRVSVKVSGKRYEVSPVVLTSDDFVATASTANVTTWGKHTLPINVRFKDTNTDVQIVSFTPASVEVFFDTEKKIVLPIEVKVTAEDDQIVAKDDGFTLLKNHEPFASSANVTIIGAETDVTKIAHVVAEVKPDEPLRETTSFPSVDLQLLTADNGTVRRSYLRIDGDETVTVTVPIYKLMQLQPTVSSNTSPPYFAEHPIQYQFNPSGPVNVAVLTKSSESTDSAAADTLTTDTLTLGAIDFSAVMPGSNAFEFTSKDIDERIQLTDEVDAFLVSFFIDGFQTRKIVVPTDSAIFSALPQDVRAAIPESTIEVTVNGLPDELESLTAGSFTITADVSDLPQTPGTYEIPLNVTMNNARSCWVYGSYSASVVVS